MLMSWLYLQPCYLCKQTGHTTMTCPYRIAPEHGCAQAANLSSDSLLATVLQREHSGRCAISLHQLPVQRSCVRTSGSQNSKLLPFT